MPPSRLLFIAFCFSCTLAGCQSSPNENATQHISATTACTIPHNDLQDIEDCDLAQDGVLEVIHSEEDITIDLPTPQEAVADTSDLWDRVAAQLILPVPDNARVTAQREWYAKHPAYMQRVSERARPFLFYIVEEIERRDMPLELALLPIVESAFDPFAYSHGRAAGMWQFIPGTAKRFGMQQTWWYDGRRDIVASTQGALDYLSYLQRLFDGDWLHALAAYNSGEGRVLNAIKKNKQKGKPTDFWHLDLPRETRAYVPKLLALADTLKHRDSFAQMWPTIDNHPVITTVDIGSQIDLAYAAELAGLPLKQLHALNPGFNRWATDPDGPHRLLLPLDASEKFMTALAASDPSERINWARHSVANGESLLKIARQYHTTVDIIQRVNELSGDVIRVGDSLMVPVALKNLDEYSLSVEQRLASTQGKKRADYKITHQVAAGDTLWDISRKYDVSVRELASWNGMAPTDPLHPGKGLVVWLDKRTATSNKDAIMRTLTYTVKRGDSLARIAEKFNVKVSDIARWNNLNAKRYLQPGQQLTLHVDVTRLNNVG